MKNLQISLTFLSFVYISSTPCFTPEDVLKENAGATVYDCGVDVKKNPIDAILKSIGLFDHLIAEPDSNDKIEKINVVISDLRRLIPSLDTLKMFELFTADEWIKWTPSKEGRILVGLLYLQENPESSNAKIMSALRGDYKLASPDLQKEVSITLKKLDVPYE